jgi:hypothetical protein
LARYSNLSDSNIDFSEYSDQIDFPQQIQLPWVYFAQNFKTKEELSIVSKSNAGSRDRKELTERQQ